MRCGAAALYTIEYSTLFYLTERAQHETRVARQDSLVAMKWGFSVDIHLQL